MIKIPFDDYIQFIPSEGNVFIEDETGLVYYDLCVTIEKGENWVRQNFSEVKENV